MSHLRPYLCPQPHHFFIAVFTRWRGEPFRRPDPECSIHQAVTPEGSAHPVPLPTPQPVTRDV